jgi:hypothetical protein
MLKVMKPPAAISTEKRLINFVLLNRFACHYKSAGLLARLLLPCKRTPHVG